MSHVPPRLDVATPSPTEIVLTRDFAAPRSRVFAALTRPELLVRWHGARGWNLVVCEVDLRPGGPWRFVSAGPDGQTMRQSGTYLEVAPPHRLVHTEAHDGSDDEPAVVTTVLAERHGRTTMTTTVRYPSQAARDAVIETPMATGAGQSYARLDAVLAAARRSDAAVDSGPGPWGSADPGVSADAGPDVSSGPSADAAPGPWGSAGPGVSADAGPDVSSDPSADAAPGPWAAAGPVPSRMPIPARREPVSPSPLPPPPRPPGRKGQVTTMSEISERYRRVSDGFVERVEAVPDAAWANPAPPEGWDARDVVRHLVEWLPGFFGQWPIEVRPAPSVDDDPLAAWLAVDRALQAGLDDPAIATDEREAGPLGSMSFEAAIDMICTPDILAHTWDLARATGMDETLDPDEVARQVAGMEAMPPEVEQGMRDSGHYGPRVPVPADADPQTRMIAFLGRQP